MIDAWWKALSEAQSSFWEYTLRELQAPSLASPLVIVGVIGSVCLAIELLGPVKQRWSVFGRPGFRQDLLYVVWMDVVIFPLGLYALLTASESVAVGLLHTWGLPRELPWAVTRLPGPVALVVAFVILDLFDWGAHYAMHRVPFLWRFHKIHHAQTTLGFASTRHFHFAEHFVFRAGFFLPVVFLGVPAQEAVAVAWLHLSLAFLSHCNVTLDIGRVNRWILTPANHFWHHSTTSPRPFGVNFGSALMLWDHLFGTFHLPDHEPVLGLEDDDVPAGFLGQQIAPFRTLG